MEQETIEEANWKVLGTKIDTFYNGAKWQAERMYSEEDMREAFIAGTQFEEDYDYNLYMENWFEQFKKN